MKTVVAMVGDYKEAEVLVNELLLSGFSREDLQLIGTQKGGPIKDWEDTIDLSIEEFFGVEEAPEVRGYYAQNVRPGGVIVTVFVEDDLADRAAAAMIGHGAVRVYDHSTEMPTLEELPVPAKMPNPEKGEGSFSPLFEAKV